MVRWFNPPCVYAGSNDCDPAAQQALHLPAGIYEHCACPTIACVQQRIIQTQGTCCIEQSLSS
eukprot:1158044-Pelagomonas_calceolata.AAC.6